MKYVGGHAHVYERVHVSGSILVQFYTNLGLIAASFRSRGRRITSVRYSERELICFIIETIGILMTLPRSEHVWSNSSGKSLAVSTRNWFLWRRYRIMKRRSAYKDHDDRDVSFESFFTIYLTSNLKNGLYDKKRNNYRWIL